MKRLFDCVVSFLILSCFLPFGILISLAIALESRGGVFYRQERIGQFGKPFRLWKFRTMRKNADQFGKLTVGMRDPRITRVGLFIRKVKLDEFPQFLNVLSGEMSIVGPRPEVQEYVAEYTAEQRRVLEVKPGITDYASLEYYNENELLGKSDDPRKTYIEEVMPAKIELNKKYIANPTIGHDLKIMWMTFLKIIN
ncbi:MAG: glycosyl transferase [Candidatus Fluviicola riflensis]|nr:MAG: glycosyl transferase [Candidatus Fluviicola riflensis]OGS76693.1 MAG: glycosyl transferase [Candidatus Fluviicola riflensis]OGS82952.1 MAG: glycosyl transferase [Fluviicola sp. RIFCSPHIGHO2_01_FULL_43_53]OGS88424.1 MAG: glycosyl transferase [Fluviicola sp. RIFCSPHIGHO2_12_FULL_43_24]